MNKILPFAFFFVIISCKTQKPLSTNFSQEPTFSADNGQVILNECGTTCHRSNKK